ncbi:MAG: vanadium-dependent haloperoxidase [Blastocatellia bacterium]
MLGSPSVTVRADTKTEIGPLNPYVRRRRALQLRQQAATFQANNAALDHPNNGDDDFYQSRIGSFTKGLPHNNLGEVSPLAYRSLIQALTTGEHDDYAAIQLGGTVKLADPQAALAYDMEGIDPCGFTMPIAPRLDSEVEGAEMAEVYWRALTRDVPFSQYDTNMLTMSAVSDLRKFSLFSHVTTGSLFRAGLPGEEAGPLISQLLWMNIPYGAMTVRQQYRVPVAGDDYMTTYASWLSIQNGTPAPFGNNFDATSRYIRNGRDLAEWDHRDFTFQAFLNAALILLSYGGAAMDDANPYKTSTTQGGFITFGGPHILDLVARVANLALKAAWFQKWQVHRRLRPEAYAGLVHLTKTGMANYPIDAKLMNSAALGALMAKNGTFLLPMAYPEGCPTHPAYPGGHATISGACATVLKAFFKESFVLPAPVIPNEDGTALNPLTEVTLTVGGELNKLASNVAFGRDTAGVHWRSDEVAGLKLGEAVAISVLQDFNSTFNEKFDGFSLTKFDGTTVTINHRPGSSGRF